MYVEHNHKVARAPLPKVLLTSFVRNVFFAMLTHLSEFPEEDIPRKHVNTADLWSQSNFKFARGFTCVLQHSLL
eukprot:936262-Amphidinium_carterae.1